MRFLLLLLLLTWNAAASCVPPPNTYDFEARNWADVQIPASGGTLSASSYRAATYFMQQVKWFGLRSRLGRVNLYLGNETNAMLCPIIYDWTDATSTNDDLIAFAAGDYTEATGLTGNGSTKYLRPSKGSGVNLSAFSNHTNIHMAAYVRTSTDQASDEMGVAYAGTGNYGIAAGNGGNTYIFMGNNTPSVANTNGGFVLSTRTASNSSVTYKDAVSIVTDGSADSGSLGAGSPVVHAFNSVGVIAAFSSRTLSYYAFGFSIPAALVSPYNIAVQNVQKSLNRTFP